MQYICHRLLLKKQEEGLKGGDKVTIDNSSKKLGLTVQLM